LIMIHRYNDDNSRSDECAAWCIAQDLVEEDEQYQTEEHYFRGIKWDRDYCYAEKDKKIRPRLHMNNLKLALEEEDIKLKFNEFSRQVIMDDKDWEDTDLMVLKAVCMKYGFKGVNSSDLLLVRTQIARETLYHPIKTYLESLTWDGVARVDTLLSTYFDAPDNDYTKAIMRKVLAGAIKRIYEPGCEMQYVLVLSGTSDIGKSSFWRRLAGEWFSDDLQLTDMGPRTGTEKIQNKWLVELAELSGMRKAEMETVKGFITRQADNCRMAYGRDTETIPRHSILVGTTNSDGFLKDITGNKRFLVVKVNKRLQDDLDRDQIWAEVMTYWKTEEIRLSAQIRILAERAANEAMETDDRLSFVEEFLNIKIPGASWRSMPIWDRRDYINNFENDKENTIFTTEERVLRDKISPVEIWCECYGRTKDSIRKSDSNEIAAILIRLGWIDRVSARDSKYGRINSRRRPQV
jgi:putative DNA primase/helicase